MLDFCKRFAYNGSCKEVQRMRGELTRKVTMRLKPATYTKVQELAEKFGVPESVIIRWAIIAYVKKRSKKDAD